MANFFKEYHAEIKAKRTTEEKAKQRERKEYSRGEIVYINPIYDENRNGKRYFVDYLSGNCVLLAKNKKDSLNGCGHIYGISDIIK